MYLVKNMLGDVKVKIFLFFLCIYWLAIYLNFSVEVCGHIDRRLIAV